MVLYGASMASLFVLPVVTGMLLEIVMQVIGTVDNEVTQAVQRNIFSSFCWTDMLFLFNAYYVQIPYEQEFVAEVLQQKAPWQLSGVRN